MEESQLVELTYERAGESISLYTDQLLWDETETEQPQLTEEINGISVGYGKTYNKFVPSDYELTQEDKERQEEGNFNIAYGTEEVILKESSNVSWIEDGVHYSLFGFDVELTPEEMIQMASEIINR